VPRDRIEKVRTGPATPVVERAQESVPARTEPVVAEKPVVVEKPAPQEPAPQEPVVVAGPAPEMVAEAVAPAVASAELQQRLEQAQRHYRGGKAKEAEALLVELVAEQPQMAEALVLLANARLDQG